MKKNNRNLQERINQMKEKTRYKNSPSGIELSEQDEVTYSEHKERHAQPISEKNGEDNKRKIRQWRRFGAFALAMGILAFVFTNTTSVDLSESAQNALANKVSTGVSAGVVLIETDENIGAQDHTITHQSSAEETKIWIWDYAAEDGDYVQVLVNGTPITDAFMIMHKPRELMVPAVGTIQIKGIRDGGGGITYAVRYDVNGTSYFNSAPEGEFNTYELVRE